MRMMTVYGYARLVGYNRQLELQPDILLSYENDKRPRFHAAPAARAQWSDGTPFTAEDFRYYGRTSLNNKDLDRRRPRRRCWPAARRRNSR